MTLISVGEGVSKSMFARSDSESCDLVTMEATSRETGKRVVKRCGVGIQGRGS